MYNPPIILLYLVICENCRYGARLVFLPSIPARMKGSLSISIIVFTRFADGRADVWGLVRRPSICCGTLLGFEKSFFRARHTLHSIWRSPTSCFQQKLLARRRHFDHWTRHVNYHWQVLPAEICALGYLHRIQSRVSQFRHQFCELGAISSDWHVLVGFFSIEPNVRAWIPVLLRRW